MTTFRTAAWTATLVLFLAAWNLFPRTQPFFAPLEYLEMALGSNSSLSLCTDHACLCASDGIQIIDSYVQHMSAMWDFVDGLGRPAMNTFVPVARRLNPATYSGWPIAYHDPVATIFLDRLITKFLRVGSYIDSRLGGFSTDIIQLFSIASKRLKKTSQMLMDLEQLQTKYKAATGSNLAYLDIGTDQVFNSTVVELASRLTVMCTDVLNRTEKLIPDVLELSILGKQVTDGLDGELDRARNVFAHLPWWDTWTLAHWEGRSRTIRYRAYLKFFQEEEHTFRALGSAASAFHGNLVGLSDYCRWYNGDDTSRLINSDRSRDTPNAQNVARNIEHLCEGVESAATAGHRHRNEGFPGWPPRLVSPSGALRIP